MSRLSRSSAGDTEAGANIWVVDISGQNATAIRCRKSRCGATKASWTAVLSAILALTVLDMGYIRRCATR